MSRNRPFIQLVLRGHLNFLIQYQVGLLGVNEEGSQDHECLKHGSNVEDGLVVVALSEHRR